jgi:sugar phosphate isomerase/epimerase
MLAGGGANSKRNFSGGAAASWILTTAAVGIQFTPHMRNPITTLLASLLIYAGASFSAGAADYKPTVGIQSWTLRNLSFDQVVDFAKKHHMTQLQLIGNHMDPKAPLEETKKKKAILDAAGLTVYTFGVTGTSMDKEDNRKLFEFAKFMGIKVIVVEPGDYRILDNLEELVKEYDIKIAIHNHGITAPYGNPYVMKQLIMHRDSRIGVCLDIGWIASTRMDVAKVFREYNGRVYDIHLKDKKVNNTPNGDVATDTEIGKGDANYKGLFDELKKVNWPGVMAIETDSQGFASAPDPFVDAAVKFVDQSFPMAALK